MSPNGESGGVLTYKDFIESPGNYFLGGSGGSRVDLATLRLWMATVDGDIHEGVWVPVLSGVGLVKVEGVLCEAETLGDLGKLDLRLG